MKNLKNYVFILFVFLGFFTLSCQIGLGSAVDTETPKIEFDSNLPDNAIIRGKFNINGTWSDDGEIYVNVSILETVDGVDKSVATWEKIEAPRTKTEAGKNSGTWTCSIDPFEKGKELHDSANYKIELLIKDKYGHSSSKTKSITIDNTPPVLVLTRPTNALGDARFDSYGQEFIISGYIGDSCERKDLKVEVFDAADSEDPIFTKIHQNINSTDFSFTVANKNSDDEELRKAYEDIYGDVTGTRKLYCKITAYDKARLYGSDDADNMGNASEYYYLYNSSVVFKEYGASDIYEINKNAREADIQDVLDSYRVSMGQFSINPNNNPSFKISGKNPLKKDGSDFTEGKETYHISNGTTVVAEVEPGLDQTALEEDSLGLYVIEWDDENNKIKDGAEKVPLLKPLKILDANGAYIQNPSITDQEIIDRNDESLGLFTNSGSTYKLKATLTHSADGVQIGKKYVFGIYGYDQKGVSVKNAEDTYGFLLSTNVAPTVKITSPADFSSYLKAGVDLTVAGTATTEVGVPDVYIYVNEVEIVKLEASSLTSTVNGLKVETAFSYTIPASLFADAKTDTGVEEFSIEAKAVYGGLPATTQKTVLYDTEAPTISITSPAEGEWLSATGDVEFSGTISDNLGAVDKVYYSTTTKSDKTDRSKWNELSFTGVSFNGQKLATTTAEGKATAYIAFYATDKAGNESDILVREINVDTANPTLSGLKYKVGEIETEAASGSSKIVKATSFGLSGNYSDSGTNVSVSVTRDGTALTVTGGNEKTGTWSVSESSVSEGSHEYEITATDESGRKAVNKLTVIADVSVPTVSLSDRPTANDTKSSSFTFGGTAYDGENGSGINKVELTITDAADSSKTATVVATGTTNWSYKVEFEKTPWNQIFATEGEKSVKLKATDNAGNEKELAISENNFIYDKNDPVLSVTTGAAQQFMKIEGFNFGGTATDTYALGTLKLTEKKYNSVSGNWEETQNSLDNTKNPAISVGVGGVWSARVPVGGAEPTDGKYQYQFTLTDSVGHEVKSQTYETEVDTTAPVITAFTSPRPAASYATDKKSLKMGTSAIDENTFRFTGSIEESNLVAEVWYKIMAATDADPVPVTDGNWEGWSAADAGNNFKFTQDFQAGTVSNENGIGEGHKKLAVCAVDAAGNVSNVATILFDVDMSYPALTLGINTNEANPNCISSNEVYYFNSNSLSGTASATDVNGVSYTYQIGTGTVYPLVLTDGAWSLPKTSFVEGTRTTFSIIATDGMGKATTEKRYVYRDETAPIISVTTPTADAYYSGTSDSTSITVEAAGTINENGVGLVASSFKYAIVPYGSEAPASSSYSSFSSDPRGSLWSEFLTIENEGTVTLYIKAQDQLGNGSDAAPQAITFSFDKAAPVLSITSGSLNNYYKAGSNFTISGTSYDTNRLKDIVIKDKVGSEEYTYSLLNSEITLDSGTIASAKDNNTKLSWSKNFTANIMTDGVHVITVTAIDTAERKDTTNTNFTVTIDKENPYLTKIVVPNTADTENNSYTFTGEAEDKASGVKIVKFSFTNPDTAPSAKIYEATGSNTWLSTVSFGTDDVFQTQGPKQIYVKVIDNAGNESGWTVAADTTKGSVASPVSFNYDKGKPVILVEGKKNFSTGKEFKINGSASDGWGLKNSTWKVVQTKKKNGTNVTTEITTNAALQSSDGTFEIKGLPRKQGSEAETELDTAEYTYSIYVEDNAGKSTVEEILVKVDTTPPEVTITAPIVEAISGSTVTFKGTATDVGEGVAAIKYAFVTTESMPTTESEWTTITNTSWEFKKILESGNGIPDADDGLREGIYYLYVKAIDAADNITIDDETPHKKYSVDLASPVISEAKAGSDVITESGTYYFNNTDGNISLSGEITETNGIENNKIKINNIDVDVSSKSGSPGVYTWTKEISGITANQITSVEILVKDVAGKTDKKTYKIYRDTQAPSIIVTNPDGDASGENSLSASNFTFRGTVNDGSGSGISTYRYKFTKTPFADSDAILTSAKDDSAETTGGWKAASGESWTKSMSLKEKKIASDITENSLNEGQWYLYIYAKDKVGIENVTEKMFWVDKNLPTVETKYLDATASHTEKSLTNTTAVTEKGLFTFKFKPDDTNGLDTVSPYTIKVERDGSELSRKTGDNSSAAGDYYISSESGVYTVNIPDENFADGLYTFTITAKDIAGKSSNEVVRNIRKDTTGPEITLTSPEFDAAKISDWQTSTVKVSGTSEDISGIDATYYSLNVDAALPAENTETAWTNAGWVKISTFANWNKNLETTDLTDSATANKIKFAAVDKIGNISVSSSVYTIKYDGTDPNLTNISAVTPTKQAVAFTMDVSDVTGIASVVITDNLNTKSIWTAVKNASGKYEKTIPLTADSAVSEDNKLIDGEHSFTIKATDVSGRTTIKTYTVVVDRGKPVIEKAPAFSTSPLYLDENSYNTLTVEASDALSGVESVFYQIVNTNTAPSSADSNWADLNRGSGKKWTSTINLNEKTDGTYYAFVKIVDGVGNEILTETGAGTSLVIDKVKPVTTVSGKTTAESEDINLTVTVTDTNPTKPVVEVEVPENGAAVTVGEDNITEQEATAAYKKYTVKIPLKAIMSGDTDTLKDGIYIVTVKEEDTNGRKADTVTHSILRDTKAPRISFTTIPADDNYKSDTTYSFAGKIEEENLLSATATLYKDGVETETKITLGVGDWTWSPANLNDGKYTVSVTATDKANNSTTQVSDYVVIDRTAPTLTFDNDADGIHYVYDEVENDGITLSGTVSDVSDALDTTAAIVVKVDGQNGTTITEAAINSEDNGHVKGSWSYKIPKGNAKGKLEENTQTIVSVTAKDRAGNVTSGTYIFYYDTADPQLEISAPVEDEQVENNERVIKGTVSDEGYGLSRLEFALKNASNQIVKDASGKNISGFWSADSEDAENNYPLTVKGESWYYAGDDGRAAVIPLGSTEGELKLYVKATEKVRLASPADTRKGTAEITREFYYDRADPEIEENSVGDSAKKTNSAFSLSGTVSDTNKVDYIKVVQGSKTYYSRDFTDAAGTFTEKSKAISFTLSSDEKSADWEMDFVPATDTETQNVERLSEGTYTFKIYVYDISGKSSQVTRKVTVDYTRPSFSSSVGDNKIDTRVDTQIDGNNWFKNASIKINAKADGTGTAIKTLSVKLNGAEDSTVFATGETGSTTVQCTNQGVNLIKIIAEDEAGNTEEKNYIVYIDTAAPLKNGDTFIYSAADGTTPVTDTQIVQGFSPYLFAVDVTDGTGSGIDSVNLSANGKESVTGVNGTEVFYWKNVTGAGSSAVTSYVYTTRPAVSAADGDKVYTDVSLSSASETAYTYSSTGSGENLVKKITADSKEYTYSHSMWVITVPAAKQVDGNLSVTVTDKVGNVTVLSSVITLEVDGSLPVSKIASPKDSDSSVAGVQVNKTITITGSAKDSGGSDLSQLDLWYNKTGSADGWTFISSYDNINAPEWSQTLNTKEAFGTISDGTTIYLCAVASDGAGNTSLDSVSGTIYTPNTVEYVDAQSKTHRKPKISPSAVKALVTDSDSKGYMEFVVSQDTDRPVITFSQLNKNTETTLKTSTVYGSVSDDDEGVIKMLYWTDSTAPTADDIPSYILSNGSGNWAADKNENWKTVEIANNSWSIETNAPDGETKWYLCIADSKGTVFSTVAAAAVDRPYVSYKDAVKVDNRTGISFKYDTTSPEIQFFGLLRKATGTTLTAREIYNEEISDDDELDSIVWKTVGNTAFGGTTNVMYLKVIVKEATGMSSEPLLLNYVNGEISESNPWSTAYGKWDANKIYVQHSDSGDNKDLYTYYIGPVVLNDEGDTYELKLTVKDNVGNTKVEKLSIIIDNTAPTDISSVSPNSLEEVNGKIVYSGLVYDDNDNSSRNLSGVKNMEYYLPKYSERNLSAVSDLNALSWKPVSTRTSLQWTIDFTSTGEGTIADLIGYSSSTYEVSTDYRNYNDNIAETDNPIYAIPVWFRITDNVENVGFNQNYRIRYNPNTDRPSVQITNPVHKTPVENPDHVVMGGTARISGMADDDEGIEAVYLQFDFDGDGIFENGVLPGGMHANCPWEEGELKAIPTKPGEKGILADGKRNWNYPLALKGSDGDIIKVRAIAVDSDTATSTSQLASAWSKTLVIKINNTIPRFENLKLVNSSGTTKEYTSDMYVSGSDWSVTGDVSVGQGAGFTSVIVYKISGIGSTQSEEEIGNLVTKPDWFTTGDNTDTRHFTIPVGNVSGLWEIRLDATDGKDAKNFNSQKLSVNLDNIAPIFAESYDDANVAEKGTIKLYGNSYSNTKGTLLNDNQVTNSDYNFTLVGRVSEDGSGYERVAFYMLRRPMEGTTGDVRIYNPMFGSGNRTDIKNSVSINTDNLPVLSVSGATRNSGTEITTSSIKGNKNIRKGGLVKIGGLYRKITDVSKRDSDGMVEFEPACDTSETSAEFVFAMIVDSNEMSDSNGNVTAESDDGDEMYESISRSGSNYTWYATFDSSTIPDGPIEIHTVAFDVAGNMSHGYAKTKISNNPPRITKVMLGTDLNGNGKYEIASEFDTFYAIKNKDEVDTSTGRDKWALDTKAEMGGNSYWTVKNGLAVIPEFVGGKAPFYYKVSAGTSNRESVETKADNETLPALADTHASVTGTVTYSTNGEGSNAVTNKGGILVMNNDAPIFDSDYEDTDYILSFSFWDSTEESTPGKDTGSTLLNAKIHMDLTDTGKPNVVIDKFHWYGEGTTGENAVTTKKVPKKYLYSDVKGNKKYNRTLFYTDDSMAEDKEVTDRTPLNAIVYAETEVPLNNIYGTLSNNGHIELEDDLAFQDSTFTGSSGTTDKDPKVSGKITFTGTAYDDVNLNSIWFSLQDSTGASIFTPEVEYATAETSGYTNSDPKFYKVAYYDKTNSKWEVAAAKDEWEFTVIDEYLNQFGHKAKWTLSIDTAQINGVAKADVSLKLMAVDHQKSGTYVSSTDASSADDGIADAVLNVPAYRMDVVPYITELETNLSKMEASENHFAKTTYSRSALGYYPVAEDEKITIKGFNFGTSPVVKLDDVSLDKGTATNDSIADVEIKTNDSGAITVTVGTGAAAVSNLNGLNNPLASYNIINNGTNNNNLSDNVEIKVWQFKTMADPVAVERVMYPTVKMSPADGRIGASFANSYYFHMAGYGNNSNTWYSHTPFLCGYDGSDANSFTFDQNGYTYGGVQYRASDLPSEGGAFNFVFSTAKPEGDMSLADVYRCNTGSARLEANCTNLRVDPTTTKTEWAYNKWRVKSPQFVAVANEDSTETTVYTAYYDSTTKQIRYRKGVVNAAGLVGNNPGFGDNGNHTDIGDVYMMLQDKEGGIGNDSLKDVWHTDGQATTGGYWDTVKAYPGFTSDINQGNAWDSTRNGERGKRHVNAADSLQTENDQIIHVLGSSGLTGNVQDIYKKEHYANGAGKYVALGVLSNGKAVIAWYDDTAKELLIAKEPDFAGDALKPNAGTDFANSYARTSAWEAATKSLGSGGEYVQLAIDSDDNIHIAHYDSSTGGELKYIKMNSATLTVIENAVIDAYDDVGSHLTINVGKDKNGNQVPYIGYYGRKHAKMAYRVNPASEKADGAVNKIFTQNWEVTYVPTTDSIDESAENTVNIAVWSDGNKVLKYDPAEREKTNPDPVGFNGNKTSAGDTVSARLVYANGTNNPVVAYVNGAGSLQYAQIKGMDSRIEFTEKQ